MIIFWLYGFNVSDSHSQRKLVGKWYQFGINLVKDIVNFLNIKVSINSILIRVLPITYKKEVMRKKKDRELPKDWRIQTQEILCQQHIQMDVEKIRNVLRSPNPDPDQFKAVVKAMQKVKARYRRKLITVERLKQQAKKR